MCGVLIRIDCELPLLGLHLSRQIRELTSVSLIFKQDYVVRIETDSSGKCVFLEIDSVPGKRRSCSDDASLS